MSTNETKSVIPEIFDVADRLPRESLERWIGVGQGMALAIEKNGK